MKCPVTGNECNPNREDLETDFNSPELDSAKLAAGPLAAAVDHALNLMVEHFDEINYCRGWSSAELDAATGGAWTVLLEAYEKARGQ